MTPGIKRLGYYTCNSKEFESKIQALMYAELTKKPVEWIFNNEVFDNYQWQFEPAGTLDMQYDARARSIREMYDYVILSYSGGADSNNILESFIRQGLHIDEIVTNWSQDIPKEFLTASRETKNNNAEFEHHVKGKLKYIADKLPATKITVLETSNVIRQSFLDAGDASWVKNKKEILSAGTTNLYNYTQFAEIRKQFDKGQRIALVLGTDKPRLQIVDNKLYMYFVDTIANIASVQDHISDYPNAEPVFFYWDPLCCDLLCKQAHTVLGYLKANQALQYAWRITDHKIDRQVREEILKQVIYTNWNSEWFQVNKSVGGWDNDLDQWFTKGLVGTKEHSIWLEGLDYVSNRLSTFLVQNGDTLALKMFSSKMYYIGDID